MGLLLLRAASLPRVLLRRPPGALLQPPSAGLWLGSSRAPRVIGGSRTSPGPCSSCQCATAAVAAGLGTRWLSVGSGSGNTYGVGVDPREKPWSQLNERQQKVVADLGWDAATWDDNKEHEQWFRELPTKMRSKAKSIGLDEQQWDTKKFLASPEGRKSDMGTAWIFAVAALLAAAGAAILNIVRTADERRRRAAVWQKSEWSELSGEEQAAVSALGLGIEGDACWRNRFEICAPVAWNTLAQEEARLAAAQSLGAGPELWPPVLEKPAENEDVLADLASAADATETFSLKLRSGMKNPSEASLGIKLDRAGVVTAVPSALDGLQLGGRQLLDVEGVDVSDSAMTADERASTLQSLLQSRSPGESIDLTFSQLSRE